MKSSKPNEEELVSLSQAGDESAFCQLYGIFLPKVYGYVASRIEHKQDAEDITSRVFFKIVEHLHSFKPRGEGSFSAWVFTIARNELKQTYRRRKFPESLVDRDEAIFIPLESDVQQKELFSQVQKAMSSLSKRQIEVIRLRFFAGLRNKEIAALLHLDERTVAAHISRAVENLRLELEVLGEKEKQI